MGGGNAQKSATARARKMAKDAKSGKGSQLAQIAQANLAYACAVCRQTFMCTVKKDVLQQHAESKHSKNTFAECFPNYEA